MRALYDHIIDAYVSDARVLSDEALRIHLERFHHPVYAPLLSLPIYAESYDALIVERDRRLER